VVREGRNTKNRRSLINLTALRKRRRRGEYHISSSDGEREGRRIKPVNGGRKDRRILENKYLSPAAYNRKKGDGIRRLTTSLLRLPLRFVTRKEQTRKKQREETRPTVFDQPPLWLTNKRDEKKYEERKKKVRTLAVPKNGVCGRAKRQVEGQICSGRIHPARREIKVKKGKFLFVRHIFAGGRERNRHGSRLPEKRRSMEPAEISRRDLLSRRVVLEEERQGLNSCLALLRLKQNARVKERPRNAEKRFQEESWTRGAGRGGAGSPPLV